MKKIKGTVMLTQECIPNQTVEDFLGDLPANLILKKMVIEGSSSEQHRKILVPNMWKKKGVTWITETFPRTRCRAVFTNKHSKKEIVEAVRWLRKNFNIPEDKLMITQIVVSDGNTQAVFARCLKNINKTRKKTPFLGLSTGKKPIVNTNGKYAAILDSFVNKQKVCCQILEETRRVTMCSKIQ